MIKRNIVFNIYTKQFAVCVWTKPELTKTESAGVWETNETRFLTADEADRLLSYNNPHSSWYSPSKECIDFVFQDKK